MFASNGAVFHLVTINIPGLLPFYIVLSLFCHLFHGRLLNMSFKIAAREILANYCYLLE